MSSGVHLYPLVSSCVEFCQVVSSCAKLCKFLLSVCEFAKFYFIELHTQMKINLCVCGCVHVCMWSGVIFVLVRIPL